MRNKIIGFLLIIFSFAGAWLWMDYQSAISVSLVRDKPVIIEIKKGDSLERIIQKMRDENMLIKPFWIKVIAFLGKTHKKIKTGEYELKPGLTLPELLELFVKGKTRRYSITFPEGWNIREILQEVEKNPYLEHQINKSDIAALIDQLGVDKNWLALKAQSQASLETLEGLFFPDTYFFEKNMSDVSILKRAYNKMQTTLEREWKEKLDGLPFKTPYEALIMASIVEKETGEKSERPQIAGVFVRRLQNKMRLQTDPTVIYGMGEKYHGAIGYKDLAAPTPYNTYVIDGLPPTPIAMPGREAIHAALHPDNGKNLYFVSRGNGTHVFTATLKEHNQEVDTYQRKKK